MSTFLGSNLTLGLVQEHNRDAHSMNQSAVLPWIPRAWVSSVEHVLHSGYLWCLCFACSVLQCGLHNRGKMKVQLNCNRKLEREMVEYTRD